MSRSPLIYRSNGYDGIPSAADFFAAMNMIMQGKAVAREDWEDEPECRCTMIQEKLCIYRNGEWHPWIISAGDMEGDDWVTWEEEE